jgi:cell division transport system permease protein
MSLRFILGEARANVRRAPSRAIGSAAALATALVVLGLCGSVALTVIQTLQTVRGKVDMEVYLKDGLPDVAVYQLQADIELLEEVDALVFISKEQALTEGRVDSRYLEALEENPLPASFRITFRPGHRTRAELEKTARQISRNQAVEEIVYGREWITALDKITRTFLVLAGMAAGCLAVIALFMVILSARLTQARCRDDIAVLCLLGARPWALKMPFVLAGMAQGGLGGGVATLLLRYGLEYVNRHLALPLTLLPLDFSLALVTAGVVLGLIGGLMVRVRWA